MPTTEELLLDLIETNGEVAARADQVIAAQSVIGFVPAEAVGVSTGSLLQAEVIKEDSRLVHLPGGEQTLANTVAPTAGALFISPAARISDLEKLTARGFYPDVDNGSNIWRLGDRVFVGKGINVTGNWLGNQGSAGPAQWSSLGADWGLRDSTFLSVAANGKMAVVGFARHADHQEATGTPQCIGVAGFVIATIAGRSSHALYGDVQYSAGSYAYGLELAVKNKGADITTTPYFSAGGTYGIWLAGGGDASYGGASANPSNTAILIGRNSNTWNRGIVFQQNGLTGADGTTGTAYAIEMGKGHIISWRAPGNHGGASIKSVVASPASQIDMTFSDNQMSLAGASGKTIFTVQYVASAVNYPSLRSAATGAPPALIANGDDTNVDLLLLAKGTGLVRFGGWAASGDVAITGYITIKDAGGTTRKLAVIA